ncbi:MAG TPA: hypothetical protein VL966_20045 [Alphaproteobacteria bacterium]|nr:hypothetical protein [Alphaproteobacteria bacterium]
MPRHDAAARRFILFALPVVLLIGASAAAWAQAGATGSSSGESGPANQSTGPTVPAPAGSGNAGTTNGTDVPGPGNSGASSGTTKVPGLDQTPPSGATTRGNTGEKSSCANGGANAAECNGPAPQR